MSVRYSGPRRTLSRRLRESQPFCIYCGGEQRAETIDHCTPIIVFDDKRRPKGLEFPSCERCHDGTRLDDQVLGLLSRVYPEDGKASDADLVKLFSAMRNNCPGLLEEMRPTPEHQRRVDEMLPGSGFGLYVGGPIVTSSMLRVAARLGLALHYKATGRVVPPDGGVAVKWFPNFHIETVGIPPKLLAILGLRKHWAKERASTRVVNFVTPARSPPKGPSVCIWPLFESRSRFWRMPPTPPRRLMNWPPRRTKSSDPASYPPLG